MTRFIFVLLASLFTTFAAGAQAQNVDWLVSIDDLGSDPTPATGVATYNFGINNAGLDIAPSTTFDFTVSTGAQIIGITGFSGCNSLPISGPGVLTCAVPPLSSGQNMTGTIDVQNDTQGTITANITVPTTGDADTANNTSSEVTSFVAGADLTGTISGPSSAVAGSFVDYTLTVTNNGPNASTGSTINFPIPVGFAASATPAGCSLGGGSYTCSVPGLNVGDDFNVIFNGQITASSSSTVTPLFNVTSGTPADPNPANNTDTINTSVNFGSDLLIEKSRTPLTGILTGDTVTFDLAVSYVGDNPNNIVVLDTLPAEYSPLTASGSGWSCGVSGQDVTCTRPSGNGAGSYVTLPSITITAEAIASGSPLNTAQVTSSGPVDPNLDNNDDDDGSAIISDPIVDFRANKSGPYSSLTVVGNTYTFPLSITNIGNTGFYGTARMEDTIPTNMEIVGITANGWTCAPALPITGGNTLTCERTYTQTTNELGPNQTTPTVDVEVLITGTGTAVNTLFVSSPDGNITDPNMGNNTTNVNSTGSVGPSSADISIVKTRTQASLFAGDVQEFELEIRNISGPQTALDVLVEDDLTQLINNTQGATDSGIVSFTTTAGNSSGPVCSINTTSASSVELSCDIATLPICVPGSTCPTITVQTRPGDDGSTRTNTAIAYSQTIADADPSNNSSTVSYTVVDRTDVTVEKVGAPDPATAGQNLTYVVTARSINNGLSQAENLSIVDTLPANLVFLGATPSTGTCSVTPTVGSVTTGAQTVECNLGTVQNGGQETVTITVRPTTAARGTTLSNNVSVSTSTQETSTTNNTDTFDVFVQNPEIDLIVNKNANLNLIPVGDDIEYTITVNNLGPSVAENVTITDNLPGSRLSYQSLSAGAASCSTPAPGSIGGTLICTWPSLEAGDSESVTVTMRGVSKGVAPNMVNVSSDEIVINPAFETNPSNNSANKDVTVITRADMEVVSKTTSSAAYHLLEDFDWTVTLRNNPGFNQAEADNVIFSDNLPSNMELVGTPSVSVVIGSATNTSCTGTAGDTSFTCDLGTVTSTSVVEITIPVQVTSVSSLPETFTNSASVVTNGSFDVNTSNNTNSGSVNITSSSLSGTLIRDFNDNQAEDAVDTGISGVTMTLTGLAFDGTSITRTTTTASDGTYTFAQIPEGTYNVQRGSVAEAYLDDGTAFLDTGNNGGTISASNSITNINVPRDTDISGYVFTQIPQARIGIAKARTGGQPSVAADGSLRQNYRLVLENFSLEPLTSVSVEDQLAGASPNLFGTFTALGTPATDSLNSGEYTAYNISTSCSGTINPSYNGDSNPILVNGITLGQASTPSNTCIIDFTVRWQPPAPLPVPASSARWNNQATTTGEGQWSGQNSATNPQLSDLSRSGSNPDGDNDNLANETSDNSITVANPPLNPSVSIDKNVDLTSISTPVAAGDVLTYSFEITNTGNMVLTDINVSDPLLGGSVTGSPIGSLDPGQSTTLTQTYTLTASDVSSGEVNNTASVTATHSLNGGTPQTVGDTDSVNVDFGDITLVKTVNTSGLSTPAQPGDVLTYSFTITNQADVTLTNVTVTDPLPGLNLTGGPISSLAPGASNNTAYSATYTLTQTDIDRGYVENSATTSGQWGVDGSGNPVFVTDTSGTNAGNDTPTRVNNLQNPDITLIKTADTSDFSDPVLVGEDIVYSFEIENTGNTTLSNVTITDPLTGLILNGVPIPTMAPGDVNTVTYTGLYEIVQQDIDNGKVVNQATVEGTYTDQNGSSQTVPDLSGTTAGNNTPTETLVPQSPEIALVKTVSIANLSAVPQVGEELVYSFTVENTGNVTLNPVTIVDTLPGIVISGGPITLAPGASDSTTFTATYALTQADIDAGRVTNQAEAVGGYSDANGTPQDVRDDSGASLSDDIPTEASITQVPGVDLVKTADTSAFSTPPQPGDIVTYNFRVENTGNVTLNTLTITDPMPGLNITGGPISSLAPGAVDNTTYSATYAITQADIDADVFTNQASITGGYTDASGAPQSTSDLSGPTSGTDAPTRVENIQDGQITLVKTIDETGLSSPAQVGDVLTYDFIIENTGNVTLNNVTLTDTLPGLTLSGAPIANMAPGDIDTATYTATYTVTQADIDAGRVTNQADVVGSYTDRNALTQTATDSSGTAAGNDTPTESKNLQVPTISLNKTADTSAFSSPVAVGDVVTYSFTVENTGNTTLSNVTITDPMPGLTLNGGPITMTPGDVDTTTFSATYALTQTDIDNGTFTNTAEAAGDFTDPDAGLQNVTDNDSATVTPAQTGEIRLVKTVDPTSVPANPQVGDVLTFEFEIQNTGNVTLDIATITDNLPGTIVSGGPITLAPGATDTTTFTATYALTQSDLDAGEVSNTANVDGTWTDATNTVQTTQDTSGTAIGNDDPTVVPLTTQASITLIKSVDTSGVSIPAQVGDTLVYSFEFTNTGTVTLHNVTITDPMTGLNLTGTPVSSLAPGASNTTAYSATYALTQADIDLGYVENQATVTGTPTTGPDVTDLSGTNASNDNPTRASNLQSPNIALVKSADTSGFSSPIQVGDQIVYSFEITNTGNVTLQNVTLTDTLPGMVLTGGPIASLAPGTNDTITYSGSYGLTQTDIDNSYVDNQATVTGSHTDATGTPQNVSDLSGTTIGDDDITRTPIGQLADIRLIKTVDDSALNTPPQPGDILSYAFEIRNVGNVTLTNVTITDAMTGLNLTGAPITMTPGDVNTTAYTGTYALTQTDIDNGFVQNTATVTGDYTDTSGNQQVSDISGSTVDDDTPTRQVNLQSPAIDLVKTVDTSAISTPAQPGEVLAYSFVVTNTGNVTLTNVTLNDALIGMNLNAPVIASLAPGAIDTLTWTGTYTLAQNDINAGEVNNQADVAGSYTDATGTPQITTDLSGTTSGTDTVTTATLARTPEISLTKTVDISTLSTPVQPGDSITYAFEIENTGNVTLENVTITDPLSGLVLTGSPIASMAPGDVNATNFAGSYTITQADIDRGFIDNTATVTGEDVLDASPVTNTDSAQALLAQTPFVALVKTADTSAFSSPVQSGDVISYSFEITNTGNVTLENVTLTDPLAGLNLVGAPISALAPGATDTLTYSGTYALTQTDINNAFVENQATVTGSYTDATGTPLSVQDLSGTTISDDTPLDTPITQTPEMRIVKTSDISAYSTPTAVGDIITYTFEVRNTGNVDLTNVIITDPLLGGPVNGSPIAELDAGESVTLTDTYALIQSDIDNGEVINTAQGEATYENRGTPATITRGSSPDPTGDPEGPTVTPVPQSPSIALQKTSDISAFSTPVAVGDIVTYTFTVENTGNATLNNVMITDPLPGINLNGGPITMAPGDVDNTTFSATYALTQADINAGFVDNQAVVTGDYTDATGAPQNTQDTSGTYLINDEATRTFVTQTPQIMLTKTADDSALNTPAAVGEEISYTFTIENTGNVDLTGITLTDAMPGLILNGAPFDLAAGATDTSTYTATYALTQNDLNNGFVENTADVTGTYTDATGAPQTTTDDDTAWVDVPQNGEIALVKTVDDSLLQTPVQPGDILTYTFTATNTGSVTLENVTLSDPLAGLVLAATDFGTLTPGASSTLTGTYAITQADIDAAGVVNQANVTATFTDNTSTPVEVTDDSGLNVTTDEPTVQTLVQTPAITLIKTATVNTPGGKVAAIGDEISYAFEIQNTGNVTLTNVLLTDPLPGMVLTGGPIASLAPSEIDRVTYTGVYAVVAQDFINAEVINQATVTGTYNDGTTDQMVTALSGAEAGSTEPTIVEMGLPEIGFTIAVSGQVDRNHNGRLDLGDGVAYTFTVENLGNVPLFDVDILLETLSLDFPSLSCTPIDLAVGEAVTLNCTGNVWTVSPEDVAAGKIVLSGEAEGASEAAIVVTDSSAAVAVPIAQNLDNPSLIVEKTANVDEVVFGDTVRYTITVRHNENDGLDIPVRLVDALPTGFSYVEGSARLDGQSVDVKTQGKTLVFPQRTLVDGQTITVRLDVRVLSSAGPGEHTNQAWAINTTGTRVSNVSEATVRVILEPVFSCGTVIGRVFDDKNHNGYFDGRPEDLKVNRSLITDQNYYGGKVGTSQTATPERGLGGIRLIAPNGVSVTTDEHGRYNLPCEALPSNIGSNFQMKLDERTLPTGFTLTTENPRVVRLTAGMVTRLDFGVNAAQPVMIDIDTRAFDGNRVSQPFAQALNGLAQDIARTPSVVRFTYHLNGEDTKTARRKLKSAERQLRNYWNGTYPLRIETKLVR